MKLRQIRKTKPRPVRYTLRYSIWTPAKGWQIITHTIWAQGGMSPLN